MRSPSGPIRVFGDDTFIVEFEHGEPIKFTLAKPGQENHRGEFHPLGYGVVFHYGPKATATDERVVHRAYRTWMGLPEEPTFVPLNA